MYSCNWYNEEFSSVVGLRYSCAWLQIEPVYVQMKVDCTFHFLPLHMSALCRDCAYLLVTLIRWLSLPCSQSQGDLLDLLCAVHLESCVCHLDTYRSLLSSAMHVYCYYQIKLRFLWLNSFSFLIILKVLYLKLAISCAFFTLYAYYILPNSTFT